MHHRSKNPEAGKPRAPGKGIVRAGQRIRTIRGPPSYFAGRGRILRGKSIGTPHSRMCAMPTQSRGHGTRDTRHCLRHVNPRRIAGRRLGRPTDRLRGVGREEAEPRRQVRRTRQRIVSREPDQLEELLRRLLGRKPTLPRIMSRTYVNSRNTAEATPQSTPGRVARDREWGRLLDPLVEVARLVLLQHQARREIEAASGSPRVSEVVDDEPRELIVCPPTLIPSGVPWLATTADAGSGK